MAAARRIRPSAAAPTRRTGKLSFEDAEALRRAAAYIDAPSQASATRRGRARPSAPRRARASSTALLLAVLEELDSFGVGIFVFRQLVALFAVAALCALILLTSGLYNAMRIDWTRSRASPSTRAAATWRIHRPRAACTWPSRRRVAGTDLSGAKNVARPIYVIMLLAALIADRWSQAVARRRAARATDYTVYGTRRKAHHEPNYRASEDRVNDACVCHCEGQWVTQSSWRSALFKGMGLPKADVEELGTVVELLQPLSMVWAY